MRFVFKKGLIHGHNSKILTHIKLNIVILRIEIIDTDQNLNPLYSASILERIYLLLIFWDYLSIMHASGHKSNGIYQYYNKSRNLNYHYHYHYHFKYHNNRIGIYGKTHNK